MKTLLLTVFLVLVFYTFGYAQFCGEFFFVSNRNIVNKIGDTITVNVTPVQTVIPDPCQSDNPLTTLIITTDTIDLLGDAIKFEIAGGFNEPHTFTWVANTTNIQFFCYSEAAALKDCLMDIMVGTGPAQHPAFSPEQKDIAGAKARQYDDIAKALAISAATCAVISGAANPICLSITGMAIAFDRTATRLQRVHEDPVDLNYTEPCPVNIEDVEDLGAGRLRRLTTRFEHVVARIGGALDAAGCSADRVAGAEQDGKDDWASFQADLAQAHLHDSSPLFGRAGTILQNIVAVLNQRGQDTSILDGIPESLVKLQGGFAP